MVGAFHMLRDETVKLRVALKLCAGLNFFASEWVKSSLAKNLASQTDAMAKVAPILRIGHIVEEDLRIFIRIPRAQRHRPARGRPHGPDMGLEPMAFGSGLPIIAHGDWQEMILNIGIAHTRF